jgi:hypothetical protein
VPDADRLVTALTGLAAAAASKARADSEAAVSRRPSTMKATLKSTFALERARQHVLAELRLVAYLTDTIDGSDPSTGPDHLRLCS